MLFTQGSHFCLFATYAIRALCSAAQFPSRAPRSTLSPASSLARHASALMAAASAHNSTATEHTEEAQRARAVLPESPAKAASHTEPLYDVVGNKGMTLPLQWPLARPQLATWEERLERSELRLGYAWIIQKKQHAQGLPVLPPCSWCGLPTGGYCDLCTKTIANAVCSACGGTDSDVLAACRPCQFPGRRPTSVTPSHLLRVPNH
jgi:hypothetical protein